MNALEKILEEMENESQLAHEEMRRCARGNPLQFDEVKGYARAMEYVVDTIRSHMDEVNSLEKKPVWDMDIIHHESYDLGRNVGWNECLETIQMNKNNSWIPVEERLPEDCEEIVLVQVSGKPADNILFDNAFEFALYEKEEGWMLDNYPEWKNPDVIAWQSLPKPYRQPKKEKSSCKEHIMSRFMKVE